jgi:hypothetical protein
MSRRRAPSALRTPISRVRSVTETSMMFMIPIPPTRRLTAAIPASSSVNTSVDSFSATRKSDRLRIVNVSARSAGSRCERRSARWTSLIV